MVFAMLGSQGATWNAYANQVLWKSLGILGRICRPMIPVFLLLTGLL